MHMCLTGRLINAATSKTNEPFDGYQSRSGTSKCRARLSRVRIARLLRARFVTALIPTSRSNFHVLALETDLRILGTRRARSCRRHALHPMLNLVRESEPLIVRVARVEDTRPSGEPILRGRLQWRMASTKTVMALSAFESWPASRARMRPILSPGWRRRF